MCSFQYGGTVARQGVSLAIRLGFSGSLRVLFPHTTMRNTHVFRKFTKKLKICGNLVYAGAGAGRGGRLLMARILPEWASGLLRARPPVFRRDANKPRAKRHGLQPVSPIPENGFQTSV